MSVLEDPDAPVRGLSSRQMAFYRFRRNPLAMIGAFIVLRVIVVAIFAPLLAPSPESAGAFVDFRNRHAPPSWDHPMGTDNVGRDVLSRVFYGYRVSLGLVVAVAVVVSSVVVIAASPKTTQSSFVLPINVALVSFNVDAFLFAFLNWVRTDFNFIAIDLASIQEQGCIIVDMVGPNGVSLDVHYV